MHALNIKYEYKRGTTCDFKPHGNFRGLSGDDAHHVCHRITFHDRKGEGGLLKSQGSCIGWHLWFRNPLDVQTTSGGFLRSPIVDGFNLREAANRTLCYTQLCNASAPYYFLYNSRGVHRSETPRSKSISTHPDVRITISDTL